MNVINPYNPPRGHCELLGHQSLAQEIISYLTQLTPPHISIIGPKYSGKSTLVNFVAEQLRNAEETFLAVVLWELTKTTASYSMPKSGIEFKTQLGQKLREQLLLKQSDIAKDLAQFLLKSPDDIETVFDNVLEEGQRVVVIFDDHDRVIEQDGLTENLWGYMENLANNSNISFVATSALPLANIGFNREVQNSPYWRKYDPVFSLEAFDGKDWGDFFAPFTQNHYVIDAATQKEIAAWSGGVPILAAELTKRLFERARTTAIRKTEVDEAAQAMLDDANCRGLLRNLWRDLDAFAQAHFTDASDNRAKVSEWNKERVDLLVQRGLLTRQAADVKGNCRLLWHWSKSSGGASGVLREAFGKAEAYEENFGALLQLRLSQITPLDSELRKSVDRVLKALDSPDMALTGLRLVFDEAMRCLWAAETSGSHLAPSSWKGVVERPSEGMRLPGTSDNRGLECAILDLITGKQGTARVALYATKPTSILAQCVKSCGDFQNHSGGIAITPAFANAACLAAVELCECLSKDLSRT